MDAPKCKLCGDRHWGMCPGTERREKPSCSSKSNASDAAAKTSPSPPPKPDVKSPATVAKRAPAGSFDRRAYQRELMRKRRAAAKAKLPSD